jgi:mono/diheme cytochrome c family protein
MTIFLTDSDVVELADWRSAFDARRTASAGTIAPGMGPPRSMTCGNGIWLRALAAALAAALNGAPVHAQATDAGRPPVRNGEQLYRQVCALCHETRIGPPLLGLELAPATIESLVRQGGAGMPAFRESEISPTELASLSAFLSASPAGRAR